MVQVNAVEERTDVQRDGTRELRVAFGPKEGEQAIAAHTALSPRRKYGEQGQLAALRRCPSDRTALAGEREPAERLEPEGHRPADFLLTCDCWSRHKLPAGPTPTRREPHGPVGGVPDAKEQAMSRFGWTAACALAGVVLSSSCEVRPTGPSTQELAELRVSALVAGTPIDLLVVRVTASDIPTPLVFNLPVQNGVAQGTIRLPPGMKRMITVDAYDTDGDTTAEGSKTIDVKPGQNPPVSIPLVSKAGQVTITVTIGPVSVVVQPTAPTVQVGATVPLSVTITAANGDVLADPADWATTNPAVATVDGNGNVMGVMPGTVDIVASFAGVAGVSHVTVGFFQIAFSSNGAIYLMNVPGGVPAQLTMGMSDFSPSWSPDGRKIAFACLQAICVVNTDGTGLVTLPNGLLASDFDPAWSPDGSKIAFSVSIIGGGAAQIFVMNPDGTGVARVTSDMADDFDPAWSPDGAKIAFTSDQSGNDQIFVMNAAGGGMPVRLTATSARETTPAWSPDDSRIAFQSDRDTPAGNFNVKIFMMNADGTGVVRLTGDFTRNDIGPSWRP